MVLILVLYNSVLKQAKHFMNLCRYQFYVTKKNIVQLCNRMATRIKRLNWKYYINQ